MQRSKPTHYIFLNLVKTFLSCLCIGFLVFQRILLSINDCIISSTLSTGSIIEALIVLMIRLHESLDGFALFSSSEFTIGQNLAKPWLNKKIDFSCSAIPAATTFTLSLRQHQNGFSDCSLLLFFLSTVWLYLKIFIIFAEARQGLLK